jgi:hypothetical protein
VRADDGAQEKQDRVPVRGRIPGDAFQCVQAADADIDVRAADLVHGFAEPVSNLTLAADVKLPPGCRGAGDHNQPGKALKQTDRAPFASWD